MRYVIKIQNGQPFEHPIREDNFVQAFPHLDINKLPPTFAYVELTPVPDTGWEYELTDPTYTWDGDRIKRVWTLVRRSEEELAMIRQDRTKAAQSYIENAVQWANEQKSLLTDSEVIQALDEYIHAMQTFEIVDALYIDLPLAPRIDANGKLIRLDAAGAPPNVIA